MPIFRVKSEEKKHWAIFFTRTPSVVSVTNKRYARSMIIPGRTHTGMTFMRSTKSYIFSRPAYLLSNHTHTTKTRSTIILAAEHMLGCLSPLIKLRRRDLIKMPDKIRSNHCTFLRSMTSLSSQ